MKISPSLIVTTPGSVQENEKKAINHSINEQKKNETLSFLHGLSYHLMNSDLLREKYARTRFAYEKFKRDLLEKPILPEIESYLRLTPTSHDSLIATPTLLLASVNDTLIRAFQMPEVAKNFQAPEIGLFLKGDHLFPQSSLLGNVEESGCSAKT